MLAAGLLGVLLMAAFVASPASLAGVRDTGLARTLVAAGSAAAATSPPSVVPLVVCPTSLAITPARQPRLPGLARLAGPTPLLGRLAAYTDREGYMTVLAPRGWRCSADYGADGSGGLSVMPAGAATGSRVEAVVAGETSVCYSCTNGQACALFPAAALAYRSAYGSACPGRRPPRESVVRLSAKLVAFEDPAFVRGDGVSSGGPFPANGVMTYVAGKDVPSYIETCTLPDGLHSICTAILNDFVARYGDR